MQLVLAYFYMLKYILYDCPNKISLHVNIKLHVHVSEEYTTICIMTGPLNLVNLM